MNRLDIGATIPSGDPMHNTFTYVMPLVVMVSLPLICARWYKPRTKIRLNDCLDAIPFDEWLLYTALIEKLRTHGEAIDTYKINLYLAELQSDGLIEKQIELANEFDGPPQRRISYRKINILPDRWRNAEELPHLF